MKAFQSALVDCSLMDLGYVGPKFLWCNGKQSLDFCRERLDRAVVNPGWSSLFNVVEVEVLGHCSSDHNPIQVSFSHSQEQTWTKRRTFHFEAGWAKHKEHGGIIKQVWRAKQNAETPWQNLHGNLNGCMRALKQWVRKQQQSGDQVIQEKLKELQNIQMSKNMESL